MTNKHRAILFFLSDTDESELESILQDLEEAELTIPASLVVNVWQPFEDVTVEKLFEHLEQLERQFDDCQKSLFENCIKAKDMIRNLRDSNLHVCPADVGDEECSCEEFDKIIDVLSD